MAESTAVSPQALTFRDVLRLVVMRRVCYAQLVSLLGDFLAIFAVISVVTYRMNGTAAQVTGVQIRSFVRRGRRRNPPTAACTRSCGRWARHALHLPSRCALVGGVRAVFFLCAAIARPHAEAMAVRGGMPPFSPTGRVRPCTATIGEGVV
jgi:hypothetical protein